MKLNFRSKFNHDFTDHGYLRSDAWKALNNFKIKRAQEARETQFVFQNNEILRSSKCLKTWTKWNLIQRVIRIKFNCGVYYICFRLKIATLFVKFGPKNRNCQFMLEIGTWTNLNMNNSIVMFMFLCFRPEVNFFSGNLFQKSKLFVEAEI